MAIHKPNKIAMIAVDAGAHKARNSFLTLLILGFLGGVFISFGFLLDIRVSGQLPNEWGSFANFLGAAVFPLGLMLVLLAGGELITGNMMTLAMAFYAKRISMLDVLKNWCFVTIANLAGALFVAYFFGHMVGLTEEGPYLRKTIQFAEMKLDDSFVQTIISGIGCNWLVCLAVWLAYGTDEFIGKVMGIWFPVMGFVAIGFQQIVANMFVIPAAIFAGHFTWLDFIGNMIPTFIGNALGGSLFVGFMYFTAFHRKKETLEVVKKVS